MLTVALALVGCAGATTPPTSVTRVTATLHGKASCGGGPCWWYFRYGTNNLYQFRTPAHETTVNTHGQQVGLPGEPVSNLTPGTTYQYQLCGQGDTVAHDTCIGPDGSPRTSQEFRTPDSKTDCLYPANNVLTLVSFGRRIGYHFRCALIFANAATQWSGWEVPWFTSAAHPPGEYLNWQDWKGCANPYDSCTWGETRQLIITMQLWPTSEDAANPLLQCSEGKYSQHAVNLATNLVRDGLGDSIIRLQQEGNDTSGRGDLPADGVGGWPTGQEEQEWARCWSNQAAVMKLVPGAHFRMDWTVNAYWRPIPLANWYPGDRVVDIIGIDAYDGGLPASIVSEPAGWNRIYTQADGIGAVQQFAAEHGKPMSFSEWGLGNRGPPDYGLGDDPVYVGNIAALVRLVPFAYQSYFLNRDSGALLNAVPANGSLWTYVAHFGGAGDAAGSPTITR
jgi:hypothetical protein